MTIWRTSQAGLKHLRKSVHNMGYVFVYSIEDVFFPPGLPRIFTVFYFIAKRGFLLFAA